MQIHVMMYEIPPCYYIVSHFKVKAINTSITSYNLILL